MTYRIVVAPAATREALRIFNRLKEKSFQGAGDWYQAYRSAIVSLIDNPERWPVAEDRPRKGRVVRQLIFKTKRGRRYRLLFAIDGDAVLILHTRAPGQRPI